MNTMKRVLVVGVGSIGERHVRCFGNTGRAIVSICELNAELRVAIAERYVIKAAFANYEDASRPLWSSADDGSVEARERLLDAVAQLPAKSAERLTNRFGFHRQMFSQIDRRGSNEIMQLD